MEENIGLRKSFCSFEQSLCTSTYEVDKVHLCERVNQLERHVQDRLQQNQELERLLEQSREELDGERLKREILEADLYQHKEALIEKARELNERDQTIDTQNSLLGFAWTETQNMASTQRDKNRTIEQLRGYVAELIKPELSDGTTEASSKRKRLSP